MNFDESLLPPSPDDDDDDDNDVDDNDNDYGDGDGELQPEFASSITCSFSSLAFVSSSYICSFDIKVCFFHHMSSS